MLKVWWCNQSESWEEEVKASHICSRKVPFRGAGIYRWMVWLVRTGDIVAHYRSDVGVFALSLAKSDGELGRYRRPGYRTGWRAKVKYFPLRRPIPLSELRSHLRRRSEPDWPFDRNGDPRQGYLFPFNVRGLRSLKRLSPHAWPSWANATLKTRLRVI
jgi:hypothetical protein